MNRYGRKALAVLTLGACAGAFLYVTKPWDLSLEEFHNSSIVSVSDSSSGDLTDSPAASPGVVLITTTDACSCALERCRAVEECLGHKLGLLDDSIAFESIDYAQQTARAEKLMDRFDVHMIPIVLVIGGDGKAVYMSEWDLDENALQAELEHLND